jgi:hypothetical protein
MTDNNRGKAFLEDDMMRERPTMTKPREAKNDGIARALLIWALRSRSSESYSPNSGPPPPLLKGRKEGGVWNCLYLH